jgi:hypothetical protein
MSAAAVLHPWAPATGSVLDRLGPRWTRVDHVPFGTSVDVEHVLLSTSTIAVVTRVETVPSAQHPVSEARWRARKIGFLLDRVARVQVLPVLAVPGLGPLGYGMRDGVLVAQLEDAATWLANLDAGTASIASERVGDMIDVLVRHTQRTDAINASYVR